MLSGTSVSGEFPSSLNKAKNKKDIPRNSEDEADSSRFLASIHQLPRGGWFPGGHSAGDKLGRGEPVTHEVSSLS